MRPVSLAALIEYILKSLLGHMKLPDVTSPPPSEKMLIDPFPLRLHSYSFIYSSFISLILLLFLLLLRLLGLISVLCSFLFRDLSYIHQSGPPID
jgi:hypothetical protein